MRPRIHILQNASFEGPGSIESWGHQNNLSITKTRFFESAWSLPRIADFDLLVIMGGPMSIYDEVQCPWLKDEMLLIRKAIDADKKILGICLGAQLVASVLGARVYRNQYKELGWFDVAKTDHAGDVSVVRKLPSRFSVFHWHGDAFDLPPGSKQLFRSDGCEQQGFALGSNVIGLQFHIEVTTDDILAVLENDAVALAVPGPFVQPAAKIKANCSTTDRLRPLLFGLMDDFTQLSVEKASLQVN